LYELQTAESSKIVQLVQHCADYIRQPIVGCANHLVPAARIPALQRSSMSRSLRLAPAQPNTLRSPARCQVPPTRCGPSGAIAPPVAAAASGHDLLQLRCQGADGGAASGHEPSQRPPPQALFLRWRAFGASMAAPPQAMTCSDHDLLRP